MTDATFFVTTLVTMFIVVDPFGIAPVFIGLTLSMSHQQRVRVTRTSVLVGGGILLVFAAVGRPLLEGLGITFPAFYIAGGILLLLIAIDMLFARPSRTKETPEEGVEAQQSPDISVFPLAIPIISGPGSIATVVLYMSLAAGNPIKIVAVLISIALALLAAYLSMRMSEMLLQVLKTTGIHVVGRVMGILLAALAVQFILNGIGSYYHTLAHPTAVIVMTKV